MEPRGRGRGYGRARGQPSGQQGGQQQQSPGPSQQQRPPRQQQPPAQLQGPQPQRGPPPQGAWVRPPQPQPSWPRPQMGAPQQVQQVAGRGRRQAEEQGAIPRKITGGGDNQDNRDGAHGSDAHGCGTSVRGRINRNQIYFTRPEVIVSKKGERGKPIKLMANYLPLLQNGKWCLYQYRVDMAPDIDHTGKRKRLVRQATAELLRGGYLFDGTVLYTPQRIPNDLAELFVQDEAENIRITIRLVGDLAWGDMHYLQLFNIIIRKCLALMGLQQVGRNYYMPDEQTILSDHKIQLWPGYFTSMRQHERDILLNVDLQFKVMRTDNVYDLLLECQGPRARMDFQSKVIGGVVLTYYNNKTYRIDDVDFNTTPEHTFTLADGSEISYRQYYQRKYNVNIRVGNQPMLISRSRPREIRAGMPETVYLVPELCQMTGLTDQQRANFHLMKTLANYTRIGVEERIRKLMEFSRKFHDKPLQEIRRWDLNIADRLVQFQGRVLPIETMFGGEKGTYSAGQQADWTRELRTRPMLFAPKMERLAVLCPSNFKIATEDFVQTLSKTASGMRWSIGTPRIFDISRHGPGDYLQEIEKIINMMQPTLILVILPNNAVNRYIAVKKICFVDRGIPCQLFVARNLNSKGIMSIATKVAIQMNCKIGGAPWTVGIPPKNLMVVGYDVCRDTVNKRKSFSGMVASLDRQMTRYFSMTSEHMAEEELSDNIATFLITACNQRKAESGNYPDQILIYRDGVGDGQLPYVYSHEVENCIKKLKAEIYKNDNLKMAFVVVSKRINTRIFTETKDNPPPGTVVDDVITLPERYDFYLVSQCVRQGTVSPTSYNVISDTMGLTPEQMQILTYKLTHMYYNWSGTVRVPAPCQYAHKLAFMVSQYLHRPAHADLADLLYYL